jgi:hypothetical protein
MIGNPFVHRLASEFDFSHLLLLLLRVIENVSTLRAWSAGDGSMLALGSGLAVELTPCAWSATFDIQRDLVAERHWLKIALGAVQFFAAIPG